MQCLFVPDSSRCKILFHIFRRPILQKHLAALRNRPLQHFLPPAKRLSSRDSRLACLGSHHHQSYEPHDHSVALTQCGSPKSCTVAVVHKLSPIWYVLNNRVCDVPVWLQRCKKQDTKFSQISVLSWHQKTFFCFEEGRIHFSPLERDDKHGLETLAPNLWSLDWINFCPLLVGEAFEKGCLKWFLVHWPQPWQLWLIL